jgi:hypothetical protein
MVSDALGFDRAAGEQAIQSQPRFYPKLVAYGYFWLSEGITCNG